MDASADARVLAFRVLSHEDHVDVLGSSSRERRGDGRQETGGTHVRPEIQALTNRQQQAPERDVVRDARITDRAHEDGIEVAQPILVRRHAPVTVVMLRAPVELFDTKIELTRVENLECLGHHLRADAVARDDGDAVSTHLATAAWSRDSLRTCAKRSMSLRW